MWQPEDEPQDAVPERPDSWAEIRRRLDQKLVGAYCAMRFDGHSRERVMREFGIGEDELDAAVRRGALVYGHDLEAALRRFAAPRVPEPPATEADERRATQPEAQRAG